MILLGLAGLIFSSAGARLVSDKIAEVGATEEFSGECGLLGGSVRNL